jgi:hypothetical protein
MPAQPVDHVFYTPRSRHLFRVGCRCWPGKTKVGEQSENVLQHPCPSQPATITTTRRFDLLECPCVKPPSLVLCPWIHINICISLLVRAGEPSVTDHVSGRSIVNATADAARKAVESLPASCQPSVHRSSPPAPQIYSTPRHPLSHDRRVSSSPSPFRAPRAESPS